MVLVITCGHKCQVMYVEVRATFWLLFWFIEELDVITSGCHDTEHMIPWIQQWYGSIWPAVDKLNSKLLCRELRIWASCLKRHASYVYQDSLWILGLCGHSFTEKLSILLRIEKFKKSNVSPCSLRDSEPCRSLTGQWVLGMNLLYIV